MTRQDLYGPVHKGLRAILFEGQQQVARTDFARAEEAARTADRLRELLAFLDEHAAHEDEAILPAIQAVSPEIHAQLASEHARVEGLGREVGRMAERLAAAPEAERISLGRRLHERLGQLIAAHLEHMAYEECQASRALWAHYTDAELLELEGRILASIPPPRMAQWLEFMLPAVSLPERAGMLAGMRAGMPTEVFEACTAGARRALGPTEWARSEQAATELGVAAGESL